MNTSQIYIIISIVVLAIITIFAIFLNKAKKKKKVSKLAGLAFAFILAGILFGNDRLIGYGLMGIGVIIAVVDIVMKSKSK